MCAKLKKILVHNISFQFEKKESLTLQMELGLNIGIREVMSYFKYLGVCFSRNSKDNDVNGKQVVFEDENSETLEQAIKKYHAKVIVDF